MQCLIIAAGKGSRLRHRAPSKPLAKLLGVALIERVIRTALAAGATDFVVVTGYQGRALENFLAGLADRLGCPITTVENRRWQEAENGSSILAARDLLQERFLLLMADHLLEAELIRRLAAADPGRGIALAVDTDRNNPLADPADVTKVRQQGGMVTAIGKDLTTYDGLDTGGFLGSPVLLSALEEASVDGDTSLTGAVRRLAGRGLVRAVDVGGCFWIDVDDEAAFRRAEDALLHRLRGKISDGPVAARLNRPLSMRLSRYLVRYPVTPNQISLFSFLLSVLATLLLLQGGRLTLALGGLLAQVASVIDGCDGEVARLKYMQSDYGAWFDAVLDRYSDALLLFGLTIHRYAVAPAFWLLWIGFAAIIGSFMLSYTADKYDRMMAARLPASGVGFRLGRDLRIFLVFLAALLDQIVPVLFLIALIMNIEVGRRLVVVRRG